MESKKEIDKKIVKSQRKKKLFFRNFEKQWCKARRKHARKHKSHKKIRSSYLEALESNEMKQEQNKQQIIIATSKDNETYLKLLTTIKPQRWRQWEPHATRSCKYESNDFWTCSAIVLEYWVIFSLKIKLNHSWKFQRNWNVPLVLLERFWWAGLNGIYLVRFGFRMWEILIVKWFLPLKIQINSKKPGFGRKISWERGNTWRLTIQFKHYFLSYLAV